VPETHDDVVKSLIWTLALGVGIAFDVERGLLGLVHDEFDSSSWKLGGGVFGMMCVLYCYLFDTVETYSFMSSMILAR
jgi:hypothetical protein